MLKKLPLSLHTFTFIHKMFHGIFCEYPPVMFDFNCGRFLVVLGCEFAILRHRVWASLMRHSPYHIYHYPSYLINISNFPFIFWINPSVLTQTSFSSSLPVMICNPRKPVLTFFRITDANTQWCRIANPTQLRYNANPTQLIAFCARRVEQDLQSCSHEY